MNQQVGSGKVFYEVDFLVVLLHSFTKGSEV